MKSRCAWKKYIALLIWVSAYLFSVIYFYRNGKLLINSDSSAELILARELNREGKFLSTNWFYSSELRVLNTQLVFKPALMLFPNHWHAARTLSIAVFLLILSVALYYLMLVCGHRTLGILCAAIAVLPFGRWYGENVIFGSFYVPHIVISLLSVGLFIQCAQRNRLADTIKEAVADRKHLCYLLLLVILGFTSCLGGLRQIMICYDPLWLTGFIMWLVLFRKEKKLSISTTVTLLDGTLLMLSSLAGYGINRSFLSNIYSFDTQSNTSWALLEMTRVWDCLGDLVRLFGWHRDVRILSLNGIANAASLILFICIIIAIAFVLLRRNQFTFQEKVLVLFTTAALFLLLMVYSFTDTYNESYWVPLLPFLFIPLLLVVSRESFQPVQAMELGTILLTVGLCTHSTIQDPYISWVQDDRNLPQAVEWLCDRGYSAGFGSFWTSDVVTELSNGKIEMWTLGSADSTELFPWLQVKEHMYTLPEGPVFLIANVKEDSVDPLPSEKTTSKLADYLAYDDGNYVIYTFDDAEQYLKAMS